MRTNNDPNFCKTYKEKSTNPKNKTYKSYKNMLRKQVPDR